MYVTPVLATCLMTWLITSQTTGLMCQFPHCETVKCEPVPDNCTGVVKMGGGYCGCCEACFTFLGQDEVCASDDALHDILYPPTKTCGEGLYCEYNTSTCRPTPWWG